MPTTSSEKPENLQPGELVKRWRNLISLGTLANWRSAGTGPKFLKIGGRVLYRRVDVEAWESANHMTPAPKAIEKHRKPDPKATKKKRTPRRAAR